MTAKESVSMSNEAIQQSELWEIARRLVSFNTVSALSNVAAAEYLAGQLEDAKLTVKLLKETVQGVEKATVLAWAGPAVRDGLIISGHTDIVPFEGQPGWTRNPLEMALDGERIYGRGVTDMKVFLAQAVLAAKQLDLATLKRPLVFIFTCDEEIAGQGSTRLVETLPDIFHDVPLPKVALIGEPTDFAVFPAHKGYAAFDIHVRGKAGHSSAPQKGVNAIEKMAEVIMLLKDVNTQLSQHVSPENARLFPELPASVFNYGTISGGLAANMIAEHCQLTASIRIAPGDNLETVLAGIQEKIDRDILPSMRTIAPESSITIENITTVPPLSSPTDTAFCAMLCRVMNQQADMGAPYATDGGQFQRLGIHSYICGPGLLEQAHQPNESIPVKNFIDGLAMVEQVIQAWCVEQ